MSSFSEIDEARKLLGLGETATLAEIKSAYRKLAHKHHPDKHSGVTEENDILMKKLNWAHKLLLDYCTDFRFSFREKDIHKTDTHEEYMRNWYGNWFDSI